jgi:hypothetical protein
MANENELKVIFGADERPLQAAVRRSESSLKRLGGFMQGLNIGIGVEVFREISNAIGNFVSGSIEQFDEAQRSLNSLKQSLDSIGRDDLFGTIVDQSKELAKEFKFLDDDAITGAFQKLIQIGGLTRDEMNRLIPVIIDLNAKQRLSGEVNKKLADTAEQVAKAIGGNGRFLKEYGVEVSSVNTNAQNLSLILNELKSKVEGAGKAFGESLEGKIAATTTRVEELQEALGSKLLPMKVVLLDFVNKAADGFANLYAKINGTFDTVQKARKELEKLNEARAKAQKFVENENTRSFLRDANDEQFQSYLNNYIKEGDKVAKILAEKLAQNPDTDSSDFPVLQSKITQANEYVNALKQTRELLKDNRTLGTYTGKDKGDDKKVVDAIKLRIQALKELIAAGVDVSKNSLELKGLEIKLILRDAQSKGFTKQEAEKLIQAKFPELAGGLELSKPLLVTAPLEFKPVTEAVTQLDAAGDDLSQGISRMYGKLTKAAQEEGAKARALVEAPLNELTASLNSIISGSFVDLGEAIGDALSGKNPVAAFLSVISDALQQLGKALIAFGIAKKLAFESL